MTESVNGRTCRNEGIQSWVCERESFHIVSFNSKRLIRVLTFCLSMLDTFTQTARKELKVKNIFEDSVKPRVFNHARMHANACYDDLARARARSWFGISGYFGYLFD